MFACRKGARLGDGNPVELHETFFLWEPLLDKVCVDALHVSFARIGAVCLLFESTYQTQTQCLYGHKCRHNVRLSQ